MRRGPKRGGAAKGAEIVSFAIPKNLANEIFANGVPQAQEKTNPGEPQLSDPTKYSSAYGLPKAYIDKIKQQAIKGSGRTENPE